MLLLLLTALSTKERKLGGLDVMCNFSPAFPARTFLFPARGDCACASQYEPFCFFSTYLKPLSHCTNHLSGSGLVPPEDTALVLTPRLRRRAVSPAVARSARMNDAGIIGVHCLVCALCPLARTGFDEELCASRSRKCACAPLFVRSSVRECRSELTALCCQSGFVA